MHRGWDEIPTDSVASVAEEPPQLCALVSIEGTVTMHVLPKHGEIRVGRGSSCDLVIEHPSVSRHHATIRLSPLTITDLGSRNGTRLRGTKLPPRIERPFAIGEAVQLGQAVVLIQHQQIVHDEPARASDALIRQVEIECVRSARSGSPFAYVCIQDDRRAVSSEALRATLPMTDILADAGATLQLLLPDTSAAEAAGAMARVQRLLDEYNSEARIALARYPFDGTTAAALLARVWEQLDAPRLAPMTAMDAVRGLIAQVATSDVSVLITGETGVGKELCAEMIHRQSTRAARPFLTLDCSSLTESLIDSELFGHERGAFTGAMSSTAGLFEAGDGGTVFLDEIGELPLPAQAKLLRVLEDRTVRRVGSTVGRELDVRFVAATNRSLPDEIEAGHFRRDLYYRINGVTITLPPLRERVGEIAGLARAFAALARGRAKPGTMSLSEDVLAALRRHAWPGNIRELRNTIERAVLLAGSGPLRPTHLSLETQPPRRASLPTMPFERSELTMTSLSDEAERLAVAMADLERQRILDALDRCAGNQTRAAHMLGVSRNTLLARLDAYDLPRPRKR